MTDPRLDHVRHVRIADVTPFDCAFEGPIRARMTDIGRTLGSQKIGLAIQTVAPGNWSSRRHRHEVCLYPNQGVAFIEGLGAEMPLDQAQPSA